MSKQLSKKAVMAKGALMALLGPKLAADAMPDLNAILIGVKRKNWLDKKPGIVEAIAPSLLAQDVDIHDVVDLLDKLDDADTGPGKDPDDVVADSPFEDVLEMLRGKISDEDLKLVEQKLAAHGGAAATDDELTPEEKAAKLAKAGQAVDEPPPFKGKPEIPGKEDGAVSKPAMDAAIRTAVQKATADARQAQDAAIKAAVKQAEDSTVKRLRAVAEAEETIKPYVGKLALAFDSAEAVYKAALETMGVDVKDVHPSAYRSILEAQPRPGVDLRLIAKDGKQPDGMAKDFPNFNRLASA